MLGCRVFLWQMKDLSLQPAVFALAVAQKSLLSHGKWYLSPLIRGHTSILSMGRQILNHWITRKVASGSLFVWAFFSYLGLGSNFFSQTLDQNRLGISVFYYYYFHACPEEM